MTREKFEPSDPRNDLALLTVAEMGRADAAAIAGGVPGVELMEKAGRSVARAVRARWRPRPVLVCCGPGNNGGDGFVAARYLAGYGWPVTVKLLGERGALKGDAAHHAALWEGAVEPLDGTIPDGTELVVDALFGAGLSRPLDGAARALVEEVGRRVLETVAVDVPSGLSGDTGAVLGEACPRAALTVTFFRKKPGHLLLPGRELCGDTAVADIGIPAGVIGEIGPRAWENGPGLWLRSLPRREASSHKYHFGHAVVAGGATMTGAARLAARAALRVGAGLVTLACPADAMAVYALSMPSLITHPLRDEGDFAGLLADGRRNAVLVGPGNGVGEATWSHTLQALAAGKAVVADADALTTFRDDPTTLFDAIRGPCVLTPHEGEFARLFPGLAGDKLARAREAARISGATLLLKGADSVIASPDGRAAINANAPASLATAGSGDVLAGLVVGLLAQGVAPFEAASAAAWVQGTLARIAGSGLLAEDLPDLIPHALCGGLKNNTTSYG